MANHLEGDLVLGPVWRSLSTIADILAAMRNGGFAPQ